MLLSHCKCYFLENIWELKTVLDVEKLIEGTGDRDWTHRRTQLARAGKSSMIYPGECTFTATGHSEAKNGIVPLLRILRPWKQKRGDEPEAGRKAFKNPIKATRQPAVRLAER